MKNLFFCFFILFFLAGNAFASPYWMSKIMAEGEDIDGANSQEIFIGISKKVINVPAPPSPPTYSVKIELISGDELLSKELKTDSNSKMFWIIAVDPNGNLLPNKPRKCLLKWDSSSFGDGYYSLKKGYTGDGETILSDLSDSESYEIYSKKIQYFTINYEPF